MTFLQVGSLERHRQQLLGGKTSKVNIFSVVERINVLFLYNIK